MTQQQQPSLNPETHSEGGPPVDRNMLIRQARYEYYNYGGRANRTFAIKLDLVDDDGHEYEQRYSVGDPSRWSMSPDETTAIPVAAGTNISKSSNAHILLAAVVNAGYPADRLNTLDISVLDGLYCYWEGTPEPGNRSEFRAQQQGEGEGQQQQQRARVILIPTRVLSLSGAPAVAQTPAVAPPPPMPTTAATPPAPAPMPAMATPPGAPPMPPPMPSPMAAPIPPATTPPAAPPVTAPVANGAVDADTTAKILSCAEKGIATYGASLTLPLLFPLVQQDYPGDVMTLFPQLQPVLMAAGYSIDPQTQAVAAPSQ